MWMLRNTNSHSKPNVDMMTNVTLNNNFELINQLVKTIDKYTVYLSSFDHGSDPFVERTFSITSPLNH